TALRVSPGANAYRSGRAGWSCEFGERQRVERGRSAIEAFERAGGELHGVDRSWTGDCGGVRAGVQALQPGDGREEHHYCDGRRKPGLGCGWSDLGRVWDQRAAVHGGKPAGSAQVRIRWLCLGIAGTGEKIESGRRIGPEYRDGAVHQRTATEDGYRVCADRTDRRGQVVSGRQATRWWE